MCICTPVCVHVCMYVMYTTRIGGWLNPCNIHQLSHNQERLPKQQKAAGRPPLTNAWVQVSPEVVAGGTHSTRVKTPVTGRGKSRGGRTVTGTPHTHDRPDIHGDEVVSTHAQNCVGRPKDQRSAVATDGDVRWGARVQCVDFLVLQVKADEPGLARFIYLKIRGGVSFQFKLDHFWYYYHFRMLWEWRRVTVITAGCLKLALDKHQLVKRCTSVCSSPSKCYSVKPLPSTLTAHSAGEWQWLEIDWM